MSPLLEWTLDRVRQQFRSQTSSRSVRYVIEEFKQCYRFTRHYERYGKRRTYIVELEQIKFHEVQVCAPGSLEFVIW